MKTRGTGVVGYNVQTAVDAKHHLIVAHEVTNTGVDRDKLSSMSQFARTEMGVADLTVVADRGYFKSEESRWEHQAVLEQMQARLDHAPDMMRIRRQTVEHPFGTIKAWMGATHFLTRTIEKVSTEMSLHVLAYNMKRLIKLLGRLPVRSGPG